MDVPRVPSCCCTDVADNQLTCSPARVGANRRILSAAAWDIIYGWMVQLVGNINVSQ